MIASPTPQPIAAAANPDPANGRWRQLTALLLALGLATALLAVTLAAGPSRASSDYVKPVPAPRPYRVYVVGDSLAEGVWATMRYVYRAAKRVELVKKTIDATGLVRDDHYSWPKALKKMLAKERLDIVIFMVGANDGQAIRVKKRYHKVGSDIWKKDYARRVDEIVKLLREKNVALFWVGMPIARSPRTRRNFAMMNAMYKAGAKKGGAKYIDIWSLFATPDGKFTSHGPDLSGKRKLLRGGDGIHFTVAGYVKLAHYIHKVMSRDLPDDMLKSIEAAKGTKVVINGGLSHKQMKALQRLLARGGYYDSSIDGLAGPGTTAAIKAYQQSKGLKATGKPSPGLLKRLKAEAS